MSAKRFRTKSTRSASGSLSALLLCVVLWIAVLIGALAVDFCHMQLVTEQLQNATDAGALAGAQDLWTNLSSAESSARTVCASNKADGYSVSSSTPGTTVNVQVTPPTIATGGQVEVTAEVTIAHMFAPIFGRTHDKLKVISVAGTQGDLTQLYANQLFPLAVSIDAVPSGRFVTTGALNSYEVGDEVVLYINSQQVKNAAFTSLSTETSANANFITDAISQALGLAPVEPGFIPSVGTGDLINLSNGIVGQVQLAKATLTAALLDPNRPPLILPVIEGDPAFVGSREVIGFISFKPTWVTFGQGGGVVETITGKLVARQVRGMSGELSGGFGGSPLSNLAIGPVQLIR